jgi:Domain of unknown function (DUF4136)
MIRTRTFLVLLALGTAFGCADNKMLIRAEIDPAANVATYHTFAWLPVEPGIPGEPRQYNIMLDREIRATVDQNLIRKGYLKASAGAPDFLIGYRADIKEKAVNSIRDYYDYRQAGGKDAVTDAYAFGHEEGSLTLDVVDGRTRQPVWRASATAVVDPNEREARIEEALRRMLEQFPSR